MEAARFGVSGTRQRVGVGTSVAVESRAGVGSQSKTTPHAVVKNVRRLLQDSLHPNDLRGTPCKSGLR